MNIFSKASAPVSKLFSYKHHIQLFSICTILVIFYCSCSTTPFQSQDTTDYLQTTNNNPIQYKKYENLKEKLVYHITTIQLDNPSISIVGSKPSLDSSYETKGETTKHFAYTQGSYVAINASPFSYPNTRLSSKRNIEGLYIHKGTLISNPVNNYAALCFSKNNKASIINKQQAIDSANVYLAVGGFWTILENNKIISFKDIKDARTAVGISEDGYTLYILTVEKNAQSKGLNYMECATILQTQGAVKAIQLDGGGSTSIIFPNSPKHSVYSNRKVANNIGFIFNPENK